MDMSATHLEPTAAEEAVIAAARANREKCHCGESHADGIAPALIARMKGYLAANPGQQFAYDDESEIVALIVPHDTDPPEILVRAACLADLLDAVEAPPAHELS